MNLAVINNQPLTMSSREISELVESRHDNVKVTIERLAAKGLISFTALQENPSSKGGRPIKLYHVNKRDSYVVVAQLSPEFTAKLVDRWQELEEKSQPNWIAQLSPEAKIAIQDLSNQLDHATQEVDRLQGVCNTMAAQFAPGMTAPKFCKQLNGVNVSMVNNQLVKMNMLNRQGQNLVPTSYSRDRYFAERNHEHENGSRSYAVLTIKGAKWLYRAYLSNKLPMKKSWDNQYSHLVFEE